MVRQEKVGSVVDLEGSERIVRGTVRFQAEAAFGGDRLHSLRIVEIPLGGYAPEWQTLSEYIYDHEGTGWTAGPSPTRTVCQNQWDRRCHGLI